MIRCWFACLLLCIASLADAVDYFVDADLGNDNADGRRALDAGSGRGPWRSLSRAASAPLQPGDVLALRCGRVWREPLEIGGSRSWKGLLITAYGDNCAADALPEIRVTSTVTTWESAGAGTAAATVGRPVGQVWVNGARLTLARHPDAGFFSMTPQRSADTAKASVLPGPYGRSFGGPAQGATAVIRTTAWSIETRRIAGVAETGDVLLESGVKYGIAPGFGFYVENARWMLNRPDEWFYDPTRQQLLIGMAPRELAGKSVEATQFDNGIVLRGASDVEIRQIRVRGADKVGILIERSTRVSLRDVEVLDSGLDGIRIEDSPGTSVADSVVRSSVRDGVVFVRAPGSKLLRSTVEDSGNVGSPKPHFAAVNGTASDELVIEQNVVKRAGYIGIRFKRTTQVAKNRVEDTCLVLDDCGAIYTWSHSDPEALYASKVEDNFVSGAPGNEEGRPPGPGITAGIYLDDLASGIDVRRNTVTGTQRGLFLHNARDIVAEDNVLAGNRWTQIMLSESGDVPAGVMQRNRLARNTVVASSADAPVVFDGTKGRDNLGQFDRNRYVNLHTAELFRIQTGTGPKRVTRLLDLDGARAEGLEKVGEVVRPGMAKAGRSRSVVLSVNLVPNGDLASGAAQWQVWDKNGVTRLALSRDCDTVPACLAVDFPPGDRGLAHSGSFSLSKGVRYVAQALLRSPGGPATVEWTVRRARAPYEPVGLSRTLLLRDGWQTVVLEFNAPEDLPAARMDIASVPGAKRLQIGFASIVPDGGASGGLPVPRLLANSDGVARSVPCPEPDEMSCSRFTELDGSKLNWPVILPAYSSRVVISAPPD